MLAALRIARGPGTDRGTRSFAGRSTVRFLQQTSQQTKNESPGQPQRVSLHKITEREFRRVRVIMVNLPIQLVNNWADILEPVYKHMRAEARRRAGPAVGVDSYRRKYSRSFVLVVWSEKGSAKDNQIWWPL